MVLKSHSSPNWTRLRLFVSPVGYLVFWGSTIYHENQLQSLPIQLFGNDYNHSASNHLLVADLPLWKYEFVNGKDDPIYCGNNMFETTYQNHVESYLFILVIQTWHWDIPICFVDLYSKKPPNLSCNSQPSNWWHRQRRAHHSGNALHRSAIAVVFITGGFAGYNNPWFKMMVDGYKNHGSNCCYTHGWFFGWWV